MKNFKKIHNPYDFSNPVSDENLFIGRKEELNEINYYLDHARTAPRPINIALIGTRASGKTSLLNMTEKQAKNREFCTVRINLDENDSKTLLNFFFKVFDSIFFSICNLGAYGGKQAKTYQTYLDIVSTCNIPKDKLFCNFLFPIQYAKAMNSNNYNINFSDNIFIDDLIQISSEVKKPIILLFDEGNVLINSRIHLEKLRNIFMNIPGFMLIIAGTEELFPIMNDVFSPIIRQFKKIIVREFQNIDETKECIEKPLQNIGVPIPIENFNINIKEIHDLSGGKPYEIQLICHILFQRIQTEKAVDMSLNLIVLEDVRRQLEATQDMASRPILSEMKKLDKEQLRSIRTFSRINNITDFKTIWALEYIFHNEKYWTEATLKKEFDNLEKVKIIKTFKNKIYFNGDDFDKIYTKYYAREKGLYIIFQNYPLQVFWELSLSSLIKQSLKDIQEMYLPIHNEEEINFNKIIESIEKPEEDVAIEYLSIIENLYPLMIKYRKHHNIPLYYVYSRLHWCKTQNCFYSNNPDNTNEINKIKNILKPISERALRFNGELKIKKEEIKVIPIDILKEYLKRTKVLKFKRNVLERIYFIMVGEYMDNKNIENAIMHANFLIDYTEDLEISYKNNIGYIFLKTDNYQLSRKLLNLSIDASKESKEVIFPALAYYNLGILEVKKGNLKKAIKNLKLCEKNVRKLKVEERQVSCLLLPIFKKGNLIFEEIKIPDLLNTTIKALKNLNSLL